MKRASVVLMMVVGFALVAVGQTRTDTWDASTADWAELHCAQNADATVECWTVLRPLVSSSGETSRPVSRPRVLRTANANRIDTVARALIPSALRQASFDVDAGSP